MKKVYIFLTVILLGLSIYYYNEYFIYKQFYPIIYENDKFVVVKNDIAPNYYNNLETVLNFYKINYEKRNGKIFISNHLLNDYDDCYNYSKKAKDPSWFVMQGLKYK